MNFIINTDLSIANTSITVDGKRLNDDTSVASISFYADAPNKQYNEDGHVMMNITSFDAEGVVKRESFTKRPEISQNVKPIGITDELNLNDFMSFLGQEIVKDDKMKLVDSIIDHCTANSIVCVDKEALSKRSIDSLKDKYNDLGLSSVES